MRANAAADPILVQLARLAGGPVPAEVRAGIPARIIDIVGASALVEYQGEAAGRGGASPDASDPGRRDHGRSSPLTDSG